LIMTSNLGAHHLVELKDGEDVETVRDSVMEVVRGSFRPEFLNRLDEVLLFSRLGREQMTGILDIQLQGLRQLLSDRRITLDIDEKAKKWLADKGYDPAYGARPLKRVIQTELQNKLAEMLLRGEIEDGSRITATEKSDNIDFKVQTPANKDSKKAA